MKTSFVLASALVAATAQAAPDGVLVLETQGTLRARLPAFDEAIRARVGSISGMKLLPKPALDFEGMKLAAGCLDDGIDCLRTIGDTIGARVVLLARVDALSDAVQVELLRVDLKGQDAKASLSFSDAGDETAADVAEAAAGLVVKGRVPRGSLELSTKAPGILEGAVVTLDGETVAITELANVPIGRHNVTIRQTGFKEFTWLGTVRPAKSVQLAVELEPEKPAAPTLAIAASPEPSVGGSPTPAIPGVEATEPNPDDRPVEVVAPVIPDEPGPPILGFILLGAAVVAGSVAIVEGLAVVSTEEELGSYCETNDCRPDPCEVQPEMCNDGDRAAAVSNVSWVLAGALGVGSIIVFALGGGDSTEVSLAPGPGGSIGLAFRR